MVDPDRTDKGSNPREVSEPLHGFRQAVEDVRKLGGFDDGEAVFSFPAASGNGGRGGDVLPAAPVHAEQSDFTYWLDDESMRETNDDHPGKKHLALKAVAVLGVLSTALVPWYFVDNLDRIVRGQDDAEVSSLIGTAVDIIHGSVASLRLMTVHALEAKKPIEHTVGLEAAKLKSLPADHEEPPVVRSEQGLSHASARAASTIRLRPPQAAWSDPPSDEPSPDPALQTDRETPISVLQVSSRSKREREADILVPLPDAATDMPRIAGIDPTPAGEAPQYASLTPGAAPAPGASGPMLEPEIVLPAPPDIQDVAIELDRPSRDPESTKAAFVIALPDPPAELIEIAASAPDPSAAPSSAQEVRHPSQAFEILLPEPPEPQALALDPARLENLSDVITAERDVALQRERERAEMLAQELAAMREELASLRSLGQLSTNSFLGMPLVPVPVPEPVVDDASSVAKAEAKGSSDVVAAPLAESPATAAVELPSVKEAAPARPASPAAQHRSFDAVAERRLLERAEALVKNHDISGARLLLERAMEGGSSRAAHLLARTYDPAVLVEWRVVGIVGDDAKARELYSRAYRSVAAEAAR